MNVAPENPTLIDRLAAEYVLGTLRGSARSRFERWRVASSLVDQRCVFWEGRLMPMLRTLKPEEPPGHVWRAIRRRLKLSPAAAHNRLRTLAWAASVVLVVGLGALLYWRALAPRPVTAVATISAPSGSLLWQVEIYGRPQGLEDFRVRAGASAARPTGHDYELWALPKTGAPVSLGILPYGQGVQRRVLTRDQQLALAHAAQLAVSLEPAGGSPTGQPTGAVVFVVPLRVLS